jgi:hypothetical protein
MASCVHFLSRDNGKLSEIRLTKQFASSLALGAERSRNVDLLAGWTYHNCIRARRPSGSAASAMVATRC